MPLKGLSHIGKSVKYVPIVCQNVEDVLPDMSVIWAALFIPFFTGFTADDLRLTTLLVIALVIATC